MIRDAGFTVKTNDEDIKRLNQEEAEKRDVLLKELEVLRPRMASKQNQVKPRVD
jgi:hypothetical protein